MILLVVVVHCSLTSILCLDIVAILDRFESLTTSLQHGLPAEIAARRQQYEYYRDKLLDFKRKTA